MKETNYVHVDEDLSNAVSNGRYHVPHEVLGARVKDGQIAIRVLRCFADRAFIETSGSRTEVGHEFSGAWWTVLETAEVPDYRVVVTYGDVEDWGDDPYRFLPTVGELDLYPLSEGCHEQLREVLGSHVKAFPSELGDVSGVSFAMRAPNAESIRVISGFNGWDGSLRTMRMLDSSGAWEIFVPGMLEGQRYKYEIQYSDLSQH